MYLCSWQSSPSLMSKESSFPPVSPPAYGHLQPCRYSDPSPIAALSPAARQPQPPVFCRSPAVRPLSSPHRREPRAILTARACPLRRGPLPSSGPPKTEATGAGEGRGDGDCGLPPYLSCLWAPTLGFFHRDWKPLPAAKPSPGNECLQGVGKLHLLPE